LELVPFVPAQAGIQKSFPATQLAAPDPRHFSIKSRRRAAVDHNCGTLNMPGLRTRQKQRKLSDVVGLTDAPRAAFSETIFACLFRRRVVRLEANCWNDVTTRSVSTMPG
jgi:hypothetical protein